MRRLLALLLFSLFLSGFTNAQSPIAVGFYNLENLFDTIDDPHINDNEFLPESRKQWGSVRYTEKLDHLAKVIASMNPNGFMDVVGLCEVENKQVVEDLIHRPALLAANYDVVHVNSPDERGIDVALIYRRDRFQLVGYHPFRLELENGKDKTRDMLLVKLMASDKFVFHFLVNHWPSRAGGQLQSNPKRMAAGLQLRHVSDSLQQNTPNCRIIAMGDLNDEPMDSSLLVGANVCYQVKDCRDKQLLDLMQPLKIQGKGSIRYKGEYEMIDQLLISSNLYHGNDWHVKQGSVQVFDPEWLKETEGKFAGNPFRTFAGDKYLGGYSDHFPVWLLLER